MKLVQTKNLACEVYQNPPSKVALDLTQEGKKYAQSQSDVEFSATNFIKRSLINTQQYNLVKTLQWFFLLFPIFIGILIIIYDRYLVYRAAVFQQQVEMLEKLWQSIEQ